MNKQKFIEFVENPASIREKDADILAELAQNYPYASLVHIMLAKARQNGEDARASLANAALYIPERSVLKLVMENQLVLSQTSETAVFPEEVPPPQEPPVSTPAQEEVSREEEVESRIPKQEIADKNDVFLELQENLRKLKEQRERFEDPLKVEETITEASASPTPEKVLEKPYTLPERLQEIVENKEEKTIIDPKRVEQINLIDNFIRNSSSIARKYRSINEVPEEQSDLTGSKHFTPPDLVTENLAQIMIRQGKTEKAIDIYEKLVLKYPQKKAYFASCIEKLKNS